MRESANTEECSAAAQKAARAHTHTILYTYTGEREHGEGVGSSGAEGHGDAGNDVLLGGLGHLARIGCRLQPFPVSPSRPRPTKKKPAAPSM